MKKIDAKKQPVSTKETASSSLAKQL